MNMRNLLILFVGLAIAKASFAPSLPIWLVYAPLFAIVGELAVIVALVLLIWLLEVLDGIRN